MASLAVSAVRARVAAGVAALSGWTESGWACDLFARDTSHLLHHTFAVGVPDTATHPGDGRQRPAEGALVVTIVGVKWAHRLRQDAQVGDYDLALDAEQAVIAAVLGISRENLHIKYQDSRRQTDGEGWVIGTLRFESIHRLALQ